MSRLIDTSYFPIAADEIDYAEEAHAAGYADLRARAEAEVIRWRSAQPIKEMVLAFGLPPMLGLYLVRFDRPIERGELAGEIEMWAVAGDLPPMCFETTDAPTPAEALRLYCAIAWDWGRAALGRRDTSQCYPIQLEPTRELGKMLLSRVKLLRKSWIPRARRGLARARKASRRAAIQQQRKLL